MSQVRKEKSSKFYKTDEFLALNEEWKVKLKDSGFEDLEEECLNEYSSLRTDKALRKETNRFKTREQEEAYYDSVREYLHTGVFLDDMEKRFWELHGEGHCYDKIAEITGSYYSMVQKRLKNIKERMKRSAK